MTSSTLASSLRMMISWSNISPAGSQSDTRLVKLPMKHELTVSAQDGNVLVPPVRIISVAVLFPAVTMPPVATGFPAAMPPPPVFLASRATVGASVIAAPVDRLNQQAITVGPFGVCRGSQAQAAEDREYEQGFAHSLPPSMISFGSR